MIPLMKVYMSPSASQEVAKTLNSGYIAQGPKADEFEKELQELLALPRRPLAIGTGTHALDLAYHLCGVGPGTSVISTSLTCLATNCTLVTRGAEIIWADVDQYGRIDPEDVGRKVRDDTVAIVAVDWSGRPCDYGALKKFGPPVIQDGAHSLLANTEGGDYRMWSFQAVKHLTCGDGGALLTPELQAERAELLRWYGLNRKDKSNFRVHQDVVEPGYKYGMNDIAATIGLENIKTVAHRVRHHRGNARVLCKELGEEYFDDSSYWFLPLREKNREAFVAHMRDRWIEASEAHVRNDTKAAFSRFQPEPGSLPGLEKFAQCQVNIPCGWWVGENDLDKIIDAVKQFRR